MSYAIQQMERYLFFKTLCDWCIEVSCEYCFVIKLLQTLSCNKVFKCTRKDKKILSVSHVHSYEIVRYRLGQRIERKKLTFMGKRMKSLE